MHHIHWAAPDVAAMKAWYVQMFGAKPGMRGTFKAGDLPGVNLTFGGAAGAAVVPTKGRSLNRIGFEVRNLEQLVKDLEAKGVKFDRPYRRARARHRDRVPHRPVGHLHRADRGPGRGAVTDDRQG